VHVNRIIERTYKLEGERPVAVEANRLRIGNYDHVSYKEAAVLALAALEVVAERGDSALLNELLTVILPTKNSSIDAAAMIDSGEEPTDEEIVRGSERFQAGVEGNQIPSNQF
jgi:hypothetical protein